jgi:hypothetical protein
VAHEAIYWFLFLDEPMKNEPTMPSERSSSECKKTRVGSHCSAL